MARFADQVAVVTGGAQGIGGATARRLAAEGARVLIADVDGVVAGQNVARIRDAGGVAEMVVADVARPAALRAAIDAAVERWGKLNILVSNAYGGGPGIEGSAVEVEEEAWDRGMALLVKALYLGAKYAVPQMQRGGRRRDRQYRLGPRFAGGAATGRLRHRQGGGDRPDAAIGG